MALAAQNRTQTVPVLQFCVTTNRHFGELPEEDSTATCVSLPYSMQDTVRYPHSTKAMSYPLLKSYSRKPYLHVPGKPYTASTRFCQEWGRCLHDNIIIGQNLLRKFGQIPSVTEWREIFSFEISDELSDFDNITWEDTGSTISVKRMKHLHQMAVDLASSHPVGLFEDSWIEADNVPPVTPDGTAWEAAVSCLGNLWVSESTSESIGINCLEEENERALCRLRCNDPYLKEMTLELPRYSRTGTERQHEMILQAFDAIATSSSLEMLDINVQFQRGD
jgi:hypothetical protein